MEVLWFIIPLLFIKHVIGNSSLKQVHIAFRHGERAPSSTFTNDPYINYSWPNGWGELTNRGKLQLYLLGENIRREYEEFIPKLYWYKDVNITSSYYVRCQMSGQLFTAGLYPPVGDLIWNPDLLWQPIPLIYLPRSRDTNIVMKAPCAKYDKILKEIRQTPGIVEIENKYQNLKDYLTKHTGQNITNIEDIESVYNTLEIEQLHNFTLPNWLNNSMMATMKKLGARNLALYSETQFMKKVKGGMFLNNAIKCMENRLKGSDETLLYLYSVHDLTLVHILRSLELVDSIKPDFGATLVFELYENGEIKVKYRNFWSDKPTIWAIPNCDSPCILNDFKNSLMNVLCFDYIKECELNS
ncbi:testicular acid phosphatase homolog [Diorhabda sublineata]|uniref:testicular acid phosphatase homolog n=1 Tax=Diorhabda sublineata TaxID=1163346 RepID=UPI0024E131FC|nr:testicular acid phosphatase homolog [Diorhabda sublineata]